MTRHEVTSGNPRSARTYLCTSCVFFPVVLAPRQRSHLWSCFTVDFEVNLSQAHLLPLASHSHVFSFNSTFRFANLSCLTPPKHSISLLAMFVYIRVPPNNPRNAPAPSLDPRLSLFSEVSYKVSIFVVLILGLRPWDHGFHSYFSIFIYFYYYFFVHSEGVEYFWWLKPTTSERKRIVS